MTQLDLGKFAPGPITAEDAAVELACGLARDERRRQVRESLALLPPAAEEAAPEVTAALVEECRRPPPVAAEDDDVWLGAVVGRLHELSARSARRPFGEARCYRVIFSYHAVLRCNTACHA